jgi:hypothetical protein
VSLLVIWSSGPHGRARDLRARGARFLAWDAAAAAQLAGLGIEHQLVRLDVETRDLVDQAAIDWTKRFGLRPLMDGRTLKEIFVWEPGDGAPAWSWWWFVELFLHHSTEATAHVRRIETFRALLAREKPAEVEASGLPAVDTVLLARTAIAEGVLFHGRIPSLSPGTAAVRHRAQRDVVKCALSAAKRWVTPPPVPPSPGGVFFLSHAAFWRERDGMPYEHYFDRLITGCPVRTVVAVGPRAAFRARGLRERWMDRLHLGDHPEPFVHMNRFTDGHVLSATRRALELSTRALQVLRESPGLTEVVRHRGVSFDDLLPPDLAGSLLLQVPWAVRSYTEMRAAIRWARPSVIALYAESSGWGRAALLAARAEGVRTVALQHGILYPKYYSYLHEWAEADAPRPDLTAVFGESAARFLVERGRYARRSVVVTGSPKFDELLAEARGRDVLQLRRTLGAEADDHLVLVASRYRPIRETHEAIGGELDRLLRAVAAFPDVRLVIKPHPAEWSAPYLSAIRSHPGARAALAPPGLSLGPLLAACDLLVTVESQSAIEALVLDKPVVLLSQPSNLRDLVEAGVALGVAAGFDPLGALEAALRDPDTRGELAQARERWVRDLAGGRDGRAVERILQLLHDPGAVDAAAPMVGS